MFSFLSFGGHFYSAERNHLGNFGGVSYEKYMCEIILNLGQMSFKDVSIFSSGYHLLRRSGPVFGP